MTNQSTVTKKRDSAATQQALLDAARDLFGMRGYDETTLRDIGERAGVDAALIARYFGNKAALYIAVLASESMQYRGATIDESIDEMVELLLTRSDTKGVGPITLALLSSEIDPEIRAAAAERIQRRLVNRLAEQMREDLTPEVRVRAEIAVASLIGIIFMRAEGGFDALSSAPREQVQALVSTMLRTALNPPELP
jgi:AcrR family transcriptional regulator